MAKRHLLSVEARTLFGNKVKSLRREGKIPANIYGHKVDPTAISVDSRTFLATLKEAGETGLINLSVSNESQPRPVLIHSTLQDPVTDAVLHVDFYQVNLKEKLVATVPLSFVGESPLVKSKEGMLLEMLQEVEVESLPTDIPSSIEVDTSVITEMDHGIFARELPLPEGVELKTDGDDMVAKVGSAQMAEEPEAETPATEEESADEAESESEAESGNQE